MAFAYQLERVQSMDRTLAQLYWQWMKTSTTISNLLLLRNKKETLGQILILGEIRRQTQTMRLTAFVWIVIHRSIQFLMNADENSGKQLDEYGEVEYRIDVNVTDGILHASISIAIVLQELNYAPVFIDCDEPRVVLESNDDEIAQTVKPSFHTIEFIQNSLAVEDTQYMEFPPRTFKLFHHGRQQLAAVIVNLNCMIRCVVLVRFSKVLLN